VLVPDFRLPDWIATTLKALAATGTVVTGIVFAMMIAFLSVTFLLSLSLSFLFHLQLHFFFFLLLLSSFFFSLLLSSSSFFFFLLL